MKIQKKGRKETGTILTFFLNIRKQSNNKEKKKSMRKTVEEAYDNLHILMVD